jgi:hypothetical protein
LAGFGVRPRKRGYAFNLEAKKAQYAETRAAGLDAKKAQ